MSKKIKGGTAPCEVERQLNVLAQVLAEDEKVLAQRKACVAKAKEALEAAVAEVING